MVLLHKFQKLLIKVFYHRTPDRLKPIYILIVQKILGTHIVGSRNTNKLLLDFGSTSGLEILFLGKNNIIFIDKSVTISNLKIDVLGNHLALNIHKNVQINGLHIWIGADYASMTIDENSVLLGASFFIAENHCSIDIGEGSLIGGGAQIRLGDGHSVIDFREMKLMNKASHVKLHPRVWLGQDCLVLKNVEIGSNTVVGARSVVTKNLPANCLAVGIPAKAVRTGITWLNQKADSLPEDWADLITEDLIN
jgi:acetyltransferase-like isoleucine patch superfamily enzyme